MSTTSTIAPFVCILRRLPRDQWISAAEQAIQINPINAVDAYMLMEAAPDGIASQEFIALLVNKYWGARGAQLTVGFLDNPQSDLRERILSHMNAWGARANVKFVATSGTANVRISRVTGGPAGGNWSYHGTDILRIDPNQPTMNLDGFTMNKPDSEFFRVVRHETGHTLGFPHEHKRIEIASRIDRQKAIAYFRAKNGWTEEMVVEQVLTPLNNSAIVATEITDPTSIMCYPLPAEIMIDNIAVVGGKNINERDYAFAESIYPRGPFPEWSHADLSQITRTPGGDSLSICGYLWGGQKHAAYFTFDGHVHELTCSTEGRWTHADLSQITRTPGGFSSAICGYEWNGQKQISYFTPDGHVHELTCSPQGVWTHADLSQITGAPGGATSAICGYIWNGQKQISYFTPNGHVHELTCSTGGRWTHADLSQITGAPGGATSAICGYLWGGQKHVAYFTRDGHVFELTCSTGGRWTHADLSQITGAPNGATSAICGYIWSGQKHVAYFTPNGHVHELTCSPQGVWSHADLSQITRAPIGVTLSICGYEWQGHKQVTYFNSDGHVIELTCTPQARWGYADLSKLTRSRGGTTSTICGYQWYTLKQISYFASDGKVHELSCAFNNP